VAEGSEPVLVVLRFVLFAALAIVGPGISLQRLVRVRWDPALVVPLGLLFCASSYWLGLLVGAPWLLPALAIPLDLLLLRPGFAGPPAEGPSLRGALAPLGLLVLLFAATQYRVNREAGDGTFLLDLGEHMDTAVHVGLTWELVAGYPPQVPGLSGVEVRYHVGSHLVRAAAARFAGIHPYDSMSRFDITLWALALVLALRGVAHALGLGRGATTLVGYLPLAGDLSSIPGLLLGMGFWAFKLGDDLVEALFYANSIMPALALGLAAVIVLARFERSGERGHLALAALLVAGAGLFKVFTGAQLLLAVGTAFLVQPRRRPLLAVAAAGALALVLLVASASPPPDAEGVRVSVVALAPTNPARTAFGLPEANGLLYVASGLAWLVLSVGFRAIGIPGAVLGLRGSSAAASVLGAFALWGWPLATFLSITADPGVDESFYFLQASGLALWVFAAPVLAAPLPRRRVMAALVLLVAFLPAAEFLFRKVPQPPEVVPAPAVQAMKVLRGESCPGDVVIMQTKIAYVPLPVVLAGRRVALADFIGYWRQFTSLSALAKRKDEVRAFFQAGDPASARDAARALDARYVYVTGRRRQDLVDGGVLQPLFDEAGQRVYRILGLGSRRQCEGAGAGPTAEPAG